MNCKIIQDLLPLYCDRVCSEESAQLVEEHLADCGDCTALLAELRKGPAPASPASLWTMQERASTSSPLTRISSFTSLDSR